MRINRTSRVVDFRTFKLALSSLVCGCFAMACFTGMDFPVSDKAPQEKAEQEKQEQQDKDGSKDGAKAELTEKQAKEQAELYKKLENYLENTKFIGKFTVDGKEDDDPVTEEYEIRKIEKMDKGDYWLLTVRIKYGKNDKVTTIPLEIKWAGKTPVITVDALKIIGMGTFDARVLIRSGKYSGTWAHNKVGGHLFGSIEKMEAPEEGKSEQKGDNASDNDQSHEEHQDGSKEGSGKAGR